MREIPYDRAAALAYAHRWAFGRNPAYAQFDLYGGDCTNYASQVLFAGTGQMNVGRNGWYFKSLSDRAPAWSGVVALYRFLTNNRELGPYAVQVPLEQAVPGDIVQLQFVEGDRFRHSPVVVAVGEPGNPDQVLVAAHTLNADWRPLSSYAYTALHPLHILGARVE